MIISFFTAREVSGGTVLLLTAMKIQGLERSVRVPSNDGQHEEVADHVSDGDVPPVLQPQPYDFASGYMLERATPAEDPNQIMEPPKPTA
jgi:hypothetical protein